MRAYDPQFVRESFIVARQAREWGNHPFGAVLVDATGTLLLRAENSVVTGRDCTGHAELNLVRQASAHFDREFLAGCTIYASTEPCPMCAGAIFWANIRRVVFGLSETSLYQMVGETAEEVLALPCRMLFDFGRKSIEVIGPLLEAEAREVHLNFW